MNGWRTHARMFLAIAGGEGDRARSAFGPVIAACAGGLALVACGRGSGGDADPGLDVANDDQGDGDLVAPS